MIIAYDLNTSPSIAPPGRNVEPDRITMRFFRFRGRNCPQVTAFSRTGPPTKGTSRRVTSRPLCGLCRRDTLEEYDERRDPPTTQERVPGLFRGGTRADLFYRLNVIPITIPPLRERRQDIGPLTDRFMTMINKERSAKSQPQVKLMPSARRRLYSYNWPGNVRELENCLRRLSAISSTGRIDQRVVENDLPQLTVSGTMDEVDFAIGPGRGLKEVLCDIERRILEEAWKQQGSQARAAKVLGLGSQQAFCKRLRLSGLTNGHTKRNINIKGRGE